VTCLKRSHHSHVAMCPGACNVMLAVLETTRSQISKHIYSNMQVNLREGGMGRSQAWTCPKYSKVPILGMTCLE
jgi:hypothetical protein